VTGHHAAGTVPPPPPVPTGTAGVGDVVAWRRLKGPTPSQGFGFVQFTDGRTVIVRPISGSTSHEVRRPVVDVAVIAPAGSFLAALNAELERIRPW